MLVFRALRAWMNGLSKPTKTRLQRHRRSLNKSSVASLIERLEAKTLLSTQTLTAFAVGQESDLDAVPTSGTIDPNPQQLIVTAHGTHDPMPTSVGRQTAVFKYDLTGIPQGTPISDVAITFNVSALLAAAPGSEGGWSAGGSEPGYPQVNLMVYSTHDGPVTADLATKPGFPAGGSPVKSTGAIQMSLGPDFIEALEGNIIFVRMETCFSNGDWVQLQTATADGQPAWPTLTLNGDNLPTQTTPNISISNLGGHYYGSAYASSVSVTDQSGNPINGTTTVLYYNGATASGDGTTTAPIDPGTYTSVAKFVSNDPLYSDVSSAPVTFTILKTAPVISVHQSGGPYTGSPYATTAIAYRQPGRLLTATGTMTFTYYSGTTATGTPLATPPKDVGTYTVVASFSSTDPYTTDGKSQPVTFSIGNSTTVKTSLTGQVNDLNNDGVFETVKINAGGLVDNYGNYPVTPETPQVGNQRPVLNFDLTNVLPGTPIDSAYLKFTIGNGVGWQFSTLSGEYTFAQFDVIGFLSPDGQINSSSGSMAGTALGHFIVTNDGTPEFRLDTSLIQQFEGQKISLRIQNAVPNTVSFGFAAVGGARSIDPSLVIYTPSTQTSAQPTITQSNPGGVYSGAPYASTATVTDSAGHSVSGTLKYTYYLGSSVNGAGTTTPPTDAGTYTSVASFTSSDPNYASVQSAPVAFRISSAVPTLAVYDHGGLYTGGPYAALATVTGLNGGTVPGTTTFMYYSGSTVSGTGTSVAPINGGTYTVVASFASSDPNYTSVQSSPLTFTILKYPPIIQVNDAGGPYTGSPYPATSIVRRETGVAATGTVTYTYYKGPTVSGAPLPSAPVDVGTYTVVASFSSSDPGTADGQSVPVTFSIGQSSTIATSMAGEVIDSNNDGIFETVKTGSQIADNQITDSWVTYATIPWVGQHVPVLLFDLTNIAPGTPIQSAYLKFTVNGWSWGFDSNTRVITFDQFNVIAFPQADPQAGINAVTVGQVTSSASPSGLQLGHFQMINGGTPQFYLDVSQLAKLEGQKIGLAIQNAIPNGDSFGIYPVATSSSIAPSLQIFAPATPTPASPTITQSNSGGVYNGQPYASNASVTDANGHSVNGTITYTYFQGNSANGVSSATPPTNAGTYTSIASFTSADSSYLNVVSSPLTFTIGKATPTVTASNPGGTFSGTAYAASATAKGIGGVAIAGTTSFTYYAGSSATGASSSTAPTNAGTYTVVASFTSSDPNYADAQSTPITFTISPIVPTISIRDSGGPYSGSNYPASATVTGLGGVAVAGTTTITYYSGLTATGTGSSTPPANAGTYTVVGDFTSNDQNYKNAQSSPVTFAIGQATPIVVVSEDGGVYNGTAYAAAGSVLGLGGATVRGTITMTYYAGSTANGAGTSIAPINAGTYTVVASFTSSDPNYRNAQSSPFTFVINKALPVVTVSDGGGLYNGNAHSASATVTGVGHVTVPGTTTFTYYSGSTASGTGSSTAPINVGTYTVIASFTSSDPNYSSAQSSPVTFTISLPTVNIQIVDRSGTYTASPFNASATVTGPGGVVPPGVIKYAYYTGTSASGNPSSAAPKTVGIFAVVASYYTLDSQTLMAKSSPVTFTITAAIPSVVVTNAGGTYNQSAFAASATVTGNAANGTSYSASPNTFRAMAVTNAPAKATPASATTVPGTTTFKYYSGSKTSGTPSSAAPTNVGTYTVVASFASRDSNYANAQSRPVTFTINKATPTISVTDTGGSFNGHAFAATATVRGVGSVAPTGTTTFKYYTGSKVQGAGSSNAPVNVGTYTVVATFVSANSNYLNATSVPVTFTISGTAPTKLVIPQQPTSAAAGDKLSLLKVAVADAQGNVVASDQSTVVLSIVGGKFSNGSSTITATAVNGVASFGTLVIITAGSFKLTATDGSLTAATSNPVTITAGKASKLSIVGQPTNANAGAAIGSFSVVITDAYGNKISTDHSAVTATISSGLFADGKSAETVTAVNGQATFSNLKINTVGSYKLTVSDGSLPHGVTQSFTIAPAVAAKLVILQQPTTGLVGQGSTTSVQVAIEDQFGNVVKTDTSTVTISLASGKFSNGSSSMTAKAVGGIATFSRLTFSTAATYALTISDANLAHATSQSILIKSH